mmetsp:Transcript_9510/g.23658  ORF Transcript_9510/g.23658 Transcript_9510/m.23658 type:complete len:113 (-) Transcript_9510:602-940(-)
MVFDITLPQLMLVFAVGAATLGPRDLPRAARSAGYLVGRAARYMRDSASTANQLLAEAEIPEVQEDGTANKEHPARPAPLPCACGAEATGELTMRCLLPSFAFLSFFFPFHS